MFKRPSKVAGLDWSMEIHPAQIEMVVRRLFIEEKGVAV